ncbi:amidohydrolase [Permianibacter sp. IMCC34836]|uniref:amidohydrolase n=1 Tax=Permianibacter fluminis TaxID=2738515 RepID=UPI0015516FA2|nr:amidohydrolase [Permianibacter fluminis]NQD37054.1 amidohydrolase [Permianibacter fluminis]
MLARNEKTSSQFTARGLIAALLPLAVGAALAAKPLPVQADDGMTQEARYLEKLYLYFHQNPELSFRETESAKRVAKELKAVGYEVSTGVGGNGVVAVLKNGSGPTLLLRADMDALPVVENTGLPYASKVTSKNDAGQTVGVMHACGHDIHMTALVGAARELKARQKEWQGTLVLVGQPAEEVSGGARAMLKAGLYDKFPKPDYAVALHTSASHPAGSVAYSIGPALASVDNVDITIRGVGGHGAYPHKTKDPIVLAAQVVLALQTIVSREIDPREPAVITVGSIHGGAKANIISEEVKMALTVRSYSPTVRELMLKSIERIVTGTALAAGMPADAMPDVRVRDEYTPSTWNEPKLTEHLVAVFGKALGADHVLATEPVMAGEDFSMYGQTADKIPSTIFWVGGVDPMVYEKSLRGEVTLPALHSPEFAPVPAPTLRTGVKALVAAALDLLPVK